MKMGAVMVAAVAALSTLQPAAQAEDKAAARAAYAEGRRRYDLNEFEAALDAFKRAYLAFEDPAFLYNIAQCHRQLSHKAEAVQFYRSYLRNVPDAPNRDDVKQTIAGLEAQIAAEKAAAPPPTPPATVVVPTVRSDATTLTASPPPPPARTPVYKKWWLWTIVGVAAAGAATGIALAITSQRTEPTFMPITVTQ